MKTLTSVTTLLLWAATAVAPLAYGQSDQGRILGTITDANGAVIPSAKVKVKNEKTGVEREVAANEAGNYLVTNLLPASYTVTAEGQQLGPTQITGIILSVGQERRVNLILQPSTLKQEVTVSGGELVTVDTSSARLGVNVSEREVATLPLNGRQVSQLYMLSPGAVNYGSGSFDDIRFSGRSNEENAIRFDGVEGSAIIDTSPGNLNGETTSVFRLEASLENVQEFRVDSSNYPAEFGTGTGGQISVVTKSGSNELHGSVFEYLRNDALDARNFFDGPSPSILRLNQFGASIGGPIIKDKFFFFGSYEGLRQRTTYPIVETTLSAAARSRAVPSIRPLLAAFPAGNAGATANPDFDLLNVNGAAPINEDYGGIRFDYNLSSKYRLYARYFRDEGSSSQTQNSTGSQYMQTITPQNGILNLTQIYSARIVNETKFGFNGYKTRVTGVPGPSPGVDLTGVTVNLTGSVALSGIAGQAGSAGIATPSGLIRLSSAFNGRGAPYTNYTLSFIDSLSYIRGNHSLKFGGEVRPIRLYNNQLGGTTYTFSNVNAFLNNQPSQIAYNGDLSDVSPWTAKGGWANLHQAYYIFYAQDEFRVTPQVTLSYGLRYEYYQPLHDVNNKNVIFNMLTGTINPPDQAYYHSSTKNFGPRLGISWAPQRFSGKTVFRVGSGFFYGPGQTEDQLQPSANDRIGRTITSGPLLAYPLNIPSIVSSYNINDPSLGYQPRAYAPGYRIPERILEYTASVEQELPGNAVLTVAYVGSQGRNLFLRGVTNLITGVATNPTTGAAIVTRQFGNRFAEVDYKTSGGTSHYNSMQTTLNRRFSRGLTFGTQWTWAHDIGNTGGSNEARTASNNYNFGAEYGTNTFDVRHSFNASALYELPYGKGRQFGDSAPAWMQTVLGGWQVGGILNARSGLPVEVLITRPDVVYRDNRNGTYVNNPIVGADGTVFTTAVINVPGGGNSRNVRRPDYVAGVDPYLHNGNKLAWINPAAFAIPQPGTFGDLGRNALKGPGLAQLDFTVDKRFRLSERLNLEFRGEIYNVLNHANFQAPSGGQPRFTNALGAGANLLQPGQPFTQGAAGGNFGALTSTVSNLIGLGTNRQVQLSLRLNF
jgi:hypothetical protein